MLTRTFRITTIALLIGLTACQQAPAPAPSGVKIGKPYSISGKTYYPEYDPTYDKIGEASWYGPGFHGKRTANGEIYNQNDLTAAHPTLPMPSLVRVTNLTNGNSLIVRINDRGPFKSNRIIDLSKKSARELGITSLAPVRVQFLKDETENYLARVQETGRPISMAEYNAAEERRKEYAIARSTEPKEQIVESIDASSHAGEIISNAAPVMTVSADNQPPQPTSGGVVSNAWADDNVTLPEPPQETLVAKADIRMSDTAQPVSHVASGKYIVQAGSFSAEENARKLNDRLSGIAEVEIDKIEIGGKSWWRVRIGPFHDKSQADEALAQVRDTGLPDARIIRQ